MTLEQAKIVKNNYLHLIGNKDSKGFYTTDIWILPSNENVRNRVIRLSMLNNLATISLVGFENEDMVVWAVDTKNLMSTGLLIYKSLN